MAWKRFPVPEFDYAPLKNLTFDSPAPVSAAEAAEIAEAAAGGKPRCGGYAVEPNSELLERLEFHGEYRQMILCALPGPGAHLLGKSYAWFNQRAFVLDRNEADAEILLNWRTPRPMTTRFGPETGVPLDRAAIYILSGRIVGNHTRGNRMMIDKDWQPPHGGEGFRIIGACDEGADDFHDSCFEVTWQ